MKSSIHSVPMPPGKGEQLDRECQLFTDYLLGAQANAYILEKYRDAHSKLQTLVPTSRFDSWLLSVALRGAWFTKVADSYARVFAPASSLRRKLIVLLAILESAAPTHRFLEVVDEGSQPLLYLRICRKGVLFALNFLLATIVFLPVHFIMLRRARNTARN